jgi:hypothetical protein
VGKKIFIWIKELEDGNNQIEVLLHSQNIYFVDQWKISSFCRKKNENGEKYWSVMNALRKRKKNFEK